jgi:hypothetical protein
MELEHETSKENIKHFILDYKRLEEVRKPILQEIEEILNDKETSWKCLPQDTKIQLLHLKYPVHKVKFKSYLKRAGHLVKIHRHCCKCSKNSKNSSSAPQLCM